MSGCIGRRLSWRPTLCEDPISQMQMWLLREGILDEDAINRLERQVDEEVQRAADKAVMAALPRSIRSCGTCTQRI